MTPRRAETPVEAARRELLEQRAALEQWEAEFAAASEELVAYQDQSGAAVLDDPGSAAQVAKHLQGLRDRREIAERAIEAQRPRVVATEGLYVGAEADALEKPLREAREAFAQHQAKTAILLKTLEEHEGRFVPEVELIDLKRRNTTVQYSDLPTSWELPKSTLLHDRVQEFEWKMLILRELAAGRDPRSHPNLGALDPARFYSPAVYGPDAVVVSPAWRDRLAQTRSAREDLRDNLAKVDGHVAELEAAVARGESGAGSPQDWTLAMPPTNEERLTAARRAQADIRARAVAEGLVDAVSETA